MLRPLPARCLALALLLAIPGPAIAQTFTEERDYWFNPAVFPGRSDLGKHPYGPAKAKGLVIWNQGYSPDKLAPEKVPPVMQYFAQDGYSGLWQGTWTNGRFAIAVIEPAENGNFKGVYRTGLGVNGDKPDDNAWLLVREGDRLVRTRTHENNAGIRLSLLDSERLQVDWTSHKGDRTMTSIFSRAR